MYLTVPSSSSTTKEFLQKLATNERPEKALKQEMIQEAVLQAWITNEGISWKFQLLRTPHFGGAHEPTRVS